MDAFMTAARNIVRFNPDSHLAGYRTTLERIRTTMMLEVTPAASYLSR
jgi:hypothetical protein